MRIRIMPPPKNIRHRSRAVSEIDELKFRRKLAEKGGVGMRTMIDHAIFSFLTLYDPHKTWC